MARTKDLDNIKEQKGRIADVAVSLFIKKGYDHTSVNEIIEAAGMSKGAFYHYYSAKTDIIDFLGRQITVAVLPDLEDLVADPKLDALSKLQKSFRLIKAYKVRNRKKIMLLAALMYKEENLYLRHQLNRISAELYVPIFSRILRQGKKEKIFDIGDPDDTAELMMYMSLGMAEIVMPIILENKYNPKTVMQFLKKARTFKRSLKRVLGLKKGELDIFDKKTLERILHGFK